jgi:uncharacterized protein (TIGR02246 family)
MKKQREDVEAVNQLLQSWHKGWENSDINALLGLFTDDPVLMPQGQPVVKGMEAIRSLYEAFFETYSVKGECTVEDIEVSGDLGYIWVSYTLTATPKMEGEEINENSKSVFIVRRQAGNAWKIARLMDNSNRQ